MALLDVVYHVLDITSKYNDKQLLDKAIELIPVSKIWSNTCALLRETQLLFYKIKLEETILLEKFFLLSLLTWFKNEFFKWYEPNCNGCGKLCEMVRYDPVSPGQSRGNTEVYECTDCQTSFNFERFNDPYILLQTRQGRCSEFSQVFTVMCFALGYEARFIYDTNDHAWTEVYSHIQSRWIHCDPSEGVVDKPLMYELGWGKKPKLIMSFSPTKEIQDVTWRYSQDHKGVLSRRDADTNATILYVVSKHNKLVLDNCSSPLKRRHIFKRMIGELAEFLTEPRTIEVFPGRVSGSQEWREVRGEMEAPVFDNGYVFQLHQSEIKVQPKYYCMWYSTNSDVYLFHWNGGTSNFHRDWRTCTYSFQNVIRKEEPDWAQTYLAREVGGKPGRVTWKFDFTNTNLNIVGISVKINAFHVDSGVVEVKAYNNENKISLKNGTAIDHLQLIPEKSLTVQVILTGGTGKISWQQSQFARQSMSEGAAVSFGVVLFIS
ncbi:peptide-N(4)-(N-acetyl-beta-glucosaminyl)asparagine amidase [Halyomorpha halys]|uniref:peptide-N(4)-(N-acetyl-beta- glucosaminyl)asparagine amidase n=1 Tax=Halyomorpha halys TaxID=286706 RepID=UPI0006D50879|nr:peptide-N(4)-(N-acetyl-beta-glucosaminyl)asparagine amidase [Halyomorpha halys]